jgi:hypothetical protein
VTLGPAQEALVAGCAATLALSLDNLTAVTRAYVQASRAAVGRLPSGRACRGWPA